MDKATNDKWKEYSLLFNGQEVNSTPINYDQELAHNKMADLFKELRQKESNEVQRWVSDFLKRPATLEDAKECKKVYINIHDYALFYKETKLGVVIHTFDISKLNSTISYHQVNQS